MHGWNAFIHWCGQLRPWCQPWVLSCNTLRKKINVICSDLSVHIRGQTMANIPKFLDIPTKEGEPPTLTFTEIDFIAVSHNQNWDTNFHDDVNGVSLILCKCREPVLKLQAEHRKHPTLFKPPQVERNSRVLLRTVSTARKQPSCSRVEWSTTPRSFSLFVNRDQHFTCFFGPVQRRNKKPTSCKRNALTCQLPTTFFRTGGTLWLFAPKHPSVLCCSGKTTAKSKLMQTGTWIDLSKRSRDNTNNGNIMQNSHCSIEWSSVLHAWIHRWCHPCPHDTHPPTQRLDNNLMCATEVLEENRRSKSLLQVPWDLIGGDEVLSAHSTW